MRKYSKKHCICSPKHRRIVKKQYPSAQITYSASLEEYNQLLSNYDKIYDRINIALVLCGTFFMVFSTTLDFGIISNWTSYAIYQRVLAIVNGTMLVTSAVLMAISIVKFLKLTRGAAMTTFDSNSIKYERLYEEKNENTTLWITLQYLKGINDLQEQIAKKQKRYNRAIVLIVIAAIIYIVSLFINKMFLQLPTTECNCLSLI